MPLPTSAKFDVFDWNSRHASTPGGNDVSIIDGVDPLTAHVLAVPPQAIAANGAINIVSDATATAANTVVVGQLQVASPNVGSLFTFEFDISLTTALPKTFDSVDNRLFVGASRLGGKSAGFLFSYQGIALASFPKDPYPSVLGGSAAYLFDSAGAPLDSITVRGVVDEDGRVTVYIAKTSDAYDPTGGTLWAEEASLTAVYNLQAKSTNAASGSAVIVYGAARSASFVAHQDPTKIAPAGDEVIFGLTSLRLSTAKIIPADRPIARALGTSQVLVGGQVLLNGATSYDKTGLPLSYLWEFVSAPAGATALLSGASRAATTDNAGVDLIGTDAANNRVRFTFKTPSAAGNSYTVVIAAAPSNNAVLTMSLSGKTLTVSLATDGVGAAVTTADALATAFYNTLSTAYSADIAALFDVKVQSLLGTGIVPAGTYAFLGGAGSTDDVVEFVPDVLGAHVISLVVDNGVKKSLPALLTVTATATSQLLRHRPNAEFVFDYLSDFWKLVRDKAQLPALWSAVAQVVSADMVTAWQNDYSKALKDISRRYQRRWQYLSFGRTVPTDTGATVVVPPNVGTYPATIAVDTVNNSVALATLQIQAASPPVTTGKFLAFSTQFPAKVVDVINVESTVPANPIVGSWKITTASKQLPLYKKLGGTGNGYFVKDPTLPAAVPTVSTLFSNVSHPLNSAVVGDFIRLFINGPYLPPVVVPIVSINPSGLTNTVKLSIAATGVDSVRYVWEHLRQVNITDIVLRRVPYIQFPQSFSLDDDALGLADYVSVVVVNPYTAEDILLHLPILAVDSTTVFVDWASLVQALNLAAAAADAGQKTTWTEADLGTLVITVAGVYRHKTTAAADDLLSIPWLGVDTIDATMQEGADYEVADNAVVLYDKVVGHVACTAGSNVVSFTSTSYTHAGVDLTASYDALLAAGVSTLVVTEGNTGVFSIVGKSGTSIQLDRRMRWTGTFPAYAPRYGAYNVGADKLWAELSYYDNYKAIESSFGLLIGLPKHELDKCSTTADYLSAVKGAWFAFVSGPTLGNLQLAVQAFLGLMFAEADAQVISISPPTQTAPGYLVLEDAGGHTYTYSYPYGAELAVNPATGKQISAFPIVPSGTVLPAAQAAELANAKVAAFTKLFDAVSVDDYISNPGLIEKELVGQDIIKKYHTFVVDVPLSLAPDTKVFSCVRKLLEQAKPAHTNFILVGSLSIIDDIVIDETLTLHPTIKFVDTPHTAPYYSLKSGVGAFGQAVALAAEEVLTWPETKTIEQFGNPLATATAVAGNPIVITSKDLSAFLVGCTTVKIASDDGAAVLGFIERTIASYTATSITFTANYAGTGGPGLTLWLNMTKVDVKERHDSGYAEGVLDNYSGDGSWNERYRVLDMVNTADSDIDVVHSLVWVPIIKTTAGAHSDKEFAVGERVEILDDATPDAGSVWAASPPVIVHVGAGAHPKIPFAVYSPQNLHPHTYLVLGFNENNVAVPQYAKEDRLDAIARAVAGLGGPVRLRGTTSGAIGTPTVYVDRTNPAHAKYFLTETLFQADKLAEWNLRSEPGFVVTVYLPDGGTVIDDLQLPLGADAEVFNTTTHLTDPLFYLHAIQYSRQLQQHPYDPLVADDDQFVPSLGPGMYMDWDLTGLVGPPTKATYEWRYGYTDVGEIAATPTALTAFTPETGTGPVGNAHVGMRLLARKSWHLTHGFTKFSIPAPSIKKATSPGTVRDVRIEGYYFVADDATRGAVPTIAPESFDGTNGGGWVFLVNTATGAEYPVVTWDFETGLNVGKTVLGADGAVQTSTGHVIEFMVPALPVAIAIYDVVVRNYRPWKMRAGGAQLYHMDEGRAVGAFHHDPGGFSGIGAGTGLWEG